MRNALDVSQSAEPDKVLYENAMKDLQKNRHDIARLTLQTLINTYPDSEYLAKAKLAIADSFYDEGGTSGLTQAVAEYRDFITFFPFLDEAAYAQLRIGMAHFRRMEKPDRDASHAQLAEQEFQTFLLKYPDHKLAPEAEQRLREVQEVRAEGNFRIGLFYSRRDTPNGRRAAIYRLSELVDRYPLYSQADRALWMLGQNLERVEQPQLAGKYYSRIVREYPLSSYVPETKVRLEKLGIPVPQPNPEALARMQKELELGRQKPGLARRALGMFKTGPDVTTAARVGSPNLTPPSEAMAGETLTAGLNLNVSGTATGPGGAVSTVTTAPGGATVSQPSTTEPKPGDASASKPVDPKQQAKEKKEKEKAKKEAEKKEKEKKEKEKKEQESSSKKKKGIRKLIPW